MSESHKSMRVLTSQEMAVLTSLVDEGSFTAAADRLGITQSAVSRTVQKIETAFGVELFTRGRKGARPTLALAEVLPKLREIQRDTESVSQALGNTNGPLRGSVKIAGFRSAVTLLLPPAVSKFMDRHASVHVSLAAVREHAGGVQQAVEDGAADFGVTSVKPPQRLRAMYLGCDRYVVIRPRGRTRDFRAHKERLVLWKERCSDLVPEILRAHNWPVARQMEVDTDTAVLGMVSHGGGFAIMPQLAVEPLPANLEKVELRTEFSRGVWLCGLPAAWESRIGRSLVRYIRDAAKEKLGSAS
jgi:DNA-binding transcriptional LysR family regulator